MKAGTMKSSRSTPIFHGGGGAVKNAMSSSKSPMPTVKKVTNMAPTGSIKTNTPPQSGVHNVTQTKGKSADMGVKAAKVGAGY